MKKRKIAVLILSVLLCLCTNTATLNIHAETNKSYIITYRSGDVGTFDPQAYREHHTDTDSCKLLESSEYYLTFQVAENAAYPELPQIYGTDGVSDEIVVKDTYAVTSGWGPEVSESVQKSEEYVVDYHKIVNGVRYTVSYVDLDGQAMKERNGKEIPGKQGTGNIGEEVECAIIITGYRVAPQQETTKVLDEKEENNNFVIVYETDDALANTVRYNYVPGATRILYNDVVNQIYVPIAAGTTSSLSQAVEEQITLLTPLTQFADGDEDVPFTTGISATQFNTIQAGLAGNTADVTTGVGADDGAMFVRRDPQNTDGQTGDDGAMIVRRDEDQNQDSLQEITDEGVALEDGISETTKETGKEDVKQQNSQGTTENGMLETIGEDGVPMYDTIDYADEHNTIMLTIAICAGVVGTGLIIMFAKKNHRK